MMKNFFKFIFVFWLSVGLSGYSFCAPRFVYKIDATRHATVHNNIGVNHLKEKNYYGAIKEFEIAISINPNTQASATYYNNLGRTYMAIGYPKLAEKAFNEALKRNEMNFEFYQNIVGTYKAQKKMESEFLSAMQSDNPLSRVTAGLILIESGKFEAGINMLDEFCFDEPEMILSKGVRTYIQNLVPNDFR